MWVKMEKTRWKKAGRQFLYVLAAEPEAKVLAAKTLCPSRSGWKNTQIWKIIYILPTVQGNNIYINNIYSVFIFKWRWISSNSLKLSLENFLYRYLTVTTLYSAREPGSENRIFEQARGKQGEKSPQIELMLLNKFTHFIGKYIGY